MSCKTVANIPYEMRSKWLSEAWFLPETELNWKMGLRKIGISLMVKCLEANNFSFFSPPLVLGRTNYIWSLFWFQVCWSVNKIFVFRRQKRKRQIQSSQILPLQGNLSSITKLLPFVDNDQNVKKQHLASPHCCKICFLKRCCYD